MTADVWNDRQIFSTGELALFLGGSHDSFTGKLLELIAKAQATPGNYSRLKFAFPREVRAWETWNSLSPAPTFAQLREALQEQDAEMQAENAAAADLPD
jgi:hypothetical protein